MAPSQIGTAEVESVMNSVEAVESALVRSFARKDDGTIELSLEVVPGEGGSRESEPTGDNQARESEGTDESASDQGGDDLRNPGEWECKCGETRQTEKELQAHWGRANGDGHGLASKPGSESESAVATPQESEDSGPNNADEYREQFGPCIATDGNGNACKYGAHEKGARFCATHKNFEAPNISGEARKAREEWESNQ